MDEPILGIQHEVLARLLLYAVPHGLDAACKAVEDGAHVAALLHGDDAELVLLVDPGEEGLLLVVEDAPPLRPVPLHTRHLQVLDEGDLYSGIRAVHPDPGGKN